MVRMYQCSVTELGMYRTVMYTRLSVTIGRRIIYSMSFRLHNISVIRNDLYYHGNMNRIFLLGLMAYVGPVELKYLNDSGRANINAFFGNISGDSLVLYV